MPGTELPKARVRMESIGGQGRRPAPNEAAPSDTGAPGRTSLARVPPPTRVRGIRKSDLESKLLITQRTGRKFGAVCEAWVDPRRLRVAAFDVAESGWGPSLVGLASGTIRGGVFVKNLREVGDVVLIQGDRDFCPEMQMNRQGLTVLSGLEVRSETGELVGKVRDFVFDPDTGRIMKLIFDRLGLPFLRVGLIDEFILDVKEIVRIVIPEGAIYIRSPAQYSQLSSGKYNFLSSLGGVLEMLGNERSERTVGQDRIVEDDGGMIEDQYQRILEESRKQQEAYYAMYGSQVPGLAKDQRSAPPESRPRSVSQQQTPQRTRRPIPEYSRVAPTLSQRRQVKSNPRGPSGQGERGTQINDWLVRDSRSPQFSEYVADEENVTSQEWQERRNP